MNVSTTSHVQVWSCVVLYAVLGLAVAYAIMAAHLLVWICMLAAEGSTVTVVLYDVDETTLFRVSAGWCKNTASVMQPPFAVDCTHIFFSAYLYVALA